MEEAITNTNWPAILGVAVLIASTTVGVMFAYLRLFIRNEIQASNQKVMEHIDEFRQDVDAKFALKELMIEKFQNLDNSMKTQFGALEGRIAALERRQ
jgi:hypothetical protein